MSGQREEIESPDPSVRRLAGGAPRSTTTGPADPVRLFAESAPGDTGRLAPRLDPRAVQHLQRLAGNQAIAGLVVQRKPADINRTDPLTYDDKGAFQNVKAPRATGSTPTKFINYLLSKGWTKPNEQLIGGHLFGAAFGGPDDETNVVPWSAQTEGLYSTFEKDFKAQADADAQHSALSSKPFSATVTSKATFIDRPDLAIDEPTLKLAGWSTGDPDMAKRHKLYQDVAERFSYVPTSVDVTISGLSTSPAGFSRAGAGIAPAFSRNPEAVKPSYVAPVRFTRNATQARDFKTMPDWAAYQSTPKFRTASDKTIDKKLRHLLGGHAADWGVAVSNSLANLKLLEGKLKAFVLNGSNEQIEGVFVMAKVDVLHYVDHATRLWMCTTIDGGLVAGWKLSQGQYDILIAKGTVG